MGDRPDAVPLTEAPVANPLLDAMAKELLPQLREPATVLDEQSMGEFNAQVILRIRDLRVEVTRDRGEMRVEVGAKAQPHLMFDDQILGEHLGLGQDRVLFAGATLAQSLRAIASFLNAYTGELSAMFGPARFPETRDALKALQAARWGRMFGGAIAPGGGVQAESE